MKGKHLITTDAWFYGADGKQYKSVWGEVEIVSDAILGIKTNVRSSNWFAKVSGEKNHVIIAGCQIHYDIRYSSLSFMPEGNQRFYYRRKRSMDNFGQWATY